MKPPVRSPALLLALVVALALLMPPAALAAPLQWEWLSPLPQLSNLYAVAYGGGRFIAAGAHGALITSPDGLHWTAETTPTSLPLTAVTAGPDLFIAAGGDEQTEGILLTSPDGHTWTSRYHAARAAIAAVAEGGGRYVAVGSRIEPTRDLAGLILLSTDGQQWRPIASPVPTKLTSIVYADGRFLAAASDQLLASTDGEHWQSRPLDAGQTIHQLLYTGAGYLAVGDQAAAPGFPDRMLYQSSDGETWAASNRLQSPDGAWLPGPIVLGPAGYLMLAGTSRATGYILASPDGTAWNPVHESQVTLRGAVCGSPGCIAVGAGGEIVLSADGTDWRSLGGGQRTGRANIAYGGGRFVVTSTRAAPQVSTDGVTWTPLPWTDPYNFLGPVVHDGAQFVALNTGMYRGVYTSADGNRWDYPYEFGGHYAVADLAYGNGRYVVTRSQGGVMWSPDLRSWTDGAGLNVTVSEIAFGRGIFVAVAGMGEGQVFTSPDGSAWTQVFTAGPGPDLTGVAYQPGRFVAVGTSADRRSGIILTSADGTNWTAQPSATAMPPLTRVAAGGGWFVAWGPDALLTSTDGLDWTAGPNRAGDALRDMAYGGGRFIGVATSGPVMAATVMAGVGCGSRFADVAGTHPACAAIEELSRQLVIAGFPDGTFRPDRTVTRAELAKMLVLALGLAPDAGRALSISDTAGHWAAGQGYLQTAVAIGAIAGFPDGTFQPDAPVTRAQVVKMVAAAAGLSPDAAPSAGRPYGDIRAKDWFGDWVATAHRAGLLGPDASNPLWTGPAFQGEQAVTRAEAAMLLANLQERP